jgi:hypothetical protein
MDESKQVIDDLLISGAMQICGVDKNTGEFLYQFTPKLKEVMPDLYKEHLNHVNSEIMGLWEKGFVHMDLLAESPIVRLSELAFNDEEILKLSREDLWALEELKRILFTKEL